MAKFSIQELERLSGVRARTIRDWIARGLVPGADRRGPGAGYSDDHLYRLLAIRRLKEELGMGLDRIPGVLGWMPRDRVRRLALGELDPPAVVQPMTHYYFASPAAFRQEPEEAEPIVSACEAMAPDFADAEPRSPLAGALRALARALARRPDPPRRPGAAEEWVEVPIHDGLSLRLRDPGPDGRVALERLGRLLADELEEVEA